MNNLLVLTRSLSHCIITVDTSPGCHRKRRLAACGEVNLIKHGLKHIIKVMTAKIVGNYST